MLGGACVSEDVIAKAVVVSVLSSALRVGLDLEPWV